MIRKGMPAPIFTAKAHTGEGLTLFDFRNRNHVILYFYPGDFKLYCTKEARCFQDSLAQITKLGEVLCGISVDSDESHAEFARELMLVLYLISDPKRELARLYEATRLAGLVRNKRMTYVIDKKEIVQHVIYHEFDYRVHVEEAIACLGAVNRKGILP